MLLYKLVPLIIESEIKGRILNPGILVGRFGV